MGVEIYIVSYEIGSGLGEPGGTHPPIIPRGIPLICRKISVTSSMFLLSGSLFYFLWAYLFSDGLSVRGNFPF